MAERRAGAALEASAVDTARGEVAPSLDRKVAFLRRPETYGAAPRAAVEAIETHMSWVFLTPERVYKLKKPVRYDFLDFSTVELRRRNCRREVRLNRRLAPDVYLRTIALTSGEAGDLRLGGQGPRRTVVDWLVEMRRLPAELMLDHEIATGALEPAEPRRLGTTLARFYRGLDPVPMTAAAYRRRFHRDVLLAYADLESAPSRLPRARLVAIRDGLETFLDRHRVALDARVRERRIVEAHGDLRPEHVCLTVPPVVIDCLEFERDFRLLDPADELAYLALECERLGAPWVREELFAAYGEVTGDRPAPELIDLYAAFRAFVRARIAILHLREPGDHTKWTARTERYLELAAAKLGAIGRR